MRQGPQEFISFGGPSLQLFDGFAAFDVVQVTVFVVIEPFFHWPMTVENTEGAFNKTVVGDDLVGRKPDLAGNSQCGIASPAQGRADNQINLRTRLF
jgi:hypothetical protein